MLGKSHSQDPPAHRRSSDDDSVALPSRRESPGRRLRSDFAWALGAVALTSLSVVLMMRLWNADLRVPFVYQIDGLFYLMVIKGILRHGWWLENPDIGAPYGQELYNFPALVGDNLHIVLLKLLGGISSDPALVLNLFYLLSFPLIALASFLVLRQLGISAGTALVCSVIYALTPYHFLRGAGHVFLAAYYSVPVGAYLILSLLSGEPLFTRRTHTGPPGLAWASKRSLITLALCLFVASAGFYYAVFTGLLLMAATMLVLVTRRDMRTLVQGGVLVGVIFGFLWLTALPILMHESANAYRLARLPEESEIYGLKLIQMVLPAVGHPIDALSNLTVSYYQSTPLPSEGSKASLGFIAALGLLWLLFAALAGCLSPRWGISNPRHRQLATVTVIAFLISTTGGFSSLIAYLFSTQIRAWNRMSIFIAFFAIVAVALLLDALRERIRVRRGRPVLVGTLLLSVLMIGLYDQSSSAIVPNYSATKVEYENDAAFVKAIDRELPPQAEVFQLPFVPFVPSPEVLPPLNITYYDPLRPYVHESDLRWSYGAVKGSTADWETALADKPTEVLLPAVSVVGFDGIYIDRFGYPDRAAELESELRNLLEAEPLVSRNSRFSFFSLLSYKERLQSQYSPEELAELKTATLTPISANFGEGFWPAEQGGEQDWRWMKRTGRITINNPSEEPRMARIKMSFATGSLSPQGSTVTVSFPDGTTERLQIGGPQTVTLQLRPGPNVVTLETDAPRQPATGDSRNLVLQVFVPVIEDQAFFPFHRSS